jgi:mRNA interferase MazF
VKRGDVVLSVMPGDIGKPRPGVIVQADELGEKTTSVLICPMSSDLSDFRRSRPLIHPSAANGLRLRSQVMTDKVSPVRRDRIRRVIGVLDARSIEMLNSALLVVLGLARQAVRQRPGARAKPRAS